MVVRQLTARLRAAEHRLDEAMRLASNPQIADMLNTADGQGVLQMADRLAVKFHALRRVLMVLSPNVAAIEASGSE